jgi:serine phosphatase RsbU (regulator of sigma subunit)
LSVSHRRGRRHRRRRPVHGCSDGQLRSSLGALLPAGHPPARALTLLDLVADDVPGSATSNVACLRLDPVTGEQTYSSAGHLPALVVGANGAARWLDEARGPVLGLVDRRPRPEAPTIRPGGATLLLFTEGLIERRGEDLDAGLERLAAAAIARRTAPSGCRIGRSWAPGGAGSSRRGVACCAGCQPGVNSVSR